MPQRQYNPSYAKTSRDVVLALKFNSRLKEQTRDASFAFINFVKLSEFVTRERNFFVTVSLDNIDKLPVYLFTFAPIRSLRLVNTSSLKHCS